jgi:hypothetical protein
LSAAISKFPAYTATVPFFMRKSLSVCAFADELNRKSLSAARWRTQMTPGIRRGRARQERNKWLLSGAGNQDGATMLRRLMWMGVSLSKRCCSLPPCVWTRDKCPACDVTDNSRLDNNPLCRRGTAEPRRRRRHHRHCARAKLIKSTERRRDFRADELCVCASMRPACFSAGGFNLYSATPAPTRPPQFRLSFILVLFIIALRWCLTDGQLFVSYN